MKRIAQMLGCWILLTLALTACGKDVYGLLEYQKREATYTGICELEDGTYTLQIHTRPNGSGEILFLAPETLEGCRYLRTEGGEYSFIAEDTILPVAANPTIETIFGLFQLKESDLLSAKVAENAGEGLNVLTFAGDVTVYLSSKDGLPLRFEHPLLTLTLHSDHREIVETKSPNQ